MVAPIDRSKGVRLVVPTPDLGMWTIRTGWGLIGPYSLVMHGSVVKRAVIGPFHLRRASRWARQASRGDRR